MTGPLVHDDTPALRHRIATSCRVLAQQGLVDGILGHVSARVAEDELLVRVRNADERGLAMTRGRDVARLRFDGTSVDVPEGARAPNELPIHVEVLRARPSVGAVIHAHPRSALLAGLADLVPRPVFGAYNIPAMRLAERGVPVYERSVLVTRPELAREMVAAMGDHPVVVLRGHGITVAAPTVEQATVLACDLDTLLEVTVELARLGATAPDVSDADATDLPDLGTGFNDTLRWNALVTQLDAPVPTSP
jgi:ribulose-5-phosphate 4-epimerase/fuculose-1-phosphate aldolase